MSNVSVVDAERYCAAGLSLGLIAVGLIIFAVGLPASIVASWRALRVDPIAALRAE
jgi:hypothetical protein